jgi:hypothetical protein
VIGVTRPGSGEIPPAAAVEVTTTDAPTTTAAPTTTELPTTTVPETTTTTVYVPPTTVYVAPPTTEAYVPPTTVWVEPEPEYIPEPEYVEPSYSGGCVIPAYICQRESGMSYTALNASSGAGGMYQFMPSTWNAIASSIAPEWVGTAPHTAPPYVQDQFAIYLWDGGAGCYHWSAC